MKLTDKEKEEKRMNARNVKVFTEKKEEQKEQRSGSNLTALNDHLFKSLERLNNLDVTEENIDKEIARAEAVQKTAATIIQQGQLALQYQKHMDDMGYDQIVETPLLSTASGALLEENKNLRERVKRHESF